MRWHVARNEAHMIQLQLLKRFPGEAQMPVMYGVKCATQDAYAFVCRRSHCLAISNVFLYVPIVCEIVDQERM